jgi:hypothetical protein
MAWIGNTTRSAELAQYGIGAQVQGGFAPPAGPGAAPTWGPTGDAIFASPGRAAQQPLGPMGGGAGGLGGVMSGFFGLVGSLFSQIQQYLGQTFGNLTNPAALQTQAAGQACPGGPSSPQPQTCGGQPWNAGQPLNGAPQSAAETFYNSANASSVGDPHNAFHGTTGAGANVGGTWDSMRAHSDLLESNSFNGGYRVSTQTTQPNANGVTLNQSATVTTGSGNTTVTLNGNGQYAVTSYGQSVSLQTGQPVGLGNGESVTLNADNSLTVNDTNGYGGTISTRLSPNTSGGVDVTDHANDVNLGGYLVNRNDGPGGNPGFPARGVGFHAQPNRSIPQLGTLPHGGNQPTSGAASYGSWGDDDALLAEANVDPMLAG